MTPVFPQSFFIAIPRAAEPENGAPVPVDSAPAPSHLLIRSPNLSGPAQPAAHICADRVRQVVICQCAVFQHRIDMRQTGPWTIAHGNTTTRLKYTQPAKAEFVPALPCQIRLEPAPADPTHAG